MLCGDFIMNKKKYYSAAVNKAVQRYSNENYDRFTLRFKKGQKHEVSAFARAKGKSLNSYIIGLIDEDMKINGIIF